MIPDTASAPAPSGEPEIPRARPISPVARIAAADTDALADLGAPKPRTPSLTPAIQDAPAEEENNALAGDPNTIVLEPRRKTWVVIRTAPGGQALFEDYLYPTAKPLRLPRWPLLYRTQGSGRRRNFTKRQAHRLRRAGVVIQ